MLEAGSLLMTDDGNDAVHCMYQDYARNMCPVYCGISIAVKVLYPDTGVQICSGCLNWQCRGQRSQGLGLVHPCQHTSSFLTHPTLGTVCSKDRPKARQNLRGDTRLLSLTQGRRRDGVDEMGSLWRSQDVPPAE